jgi:hypothetical protein
MMDETVSQNKSLSLLSCLCHKFCHCDAKVANTCLNREVLL